MAQKSPWGQEPDKDDRPSYLSEPNANSPVDPSGPTSRKAAFHDATGENNSTDKQSVHAGWRVPLDGTDPAQGLEECLVAQSFSPENPRSPQGTAGNETPNFASPNNNQSFEAFVGVPFRLDVQGIDVENEAIAIVRTDSVSWLSFVDNNNGTGTYTGTPTSGDIGTPTIVYTVDDGINSPVSQSNSIVVS